MTCTRPTLTDYFVFHQHLGISGAAAERGSKGSCCETRSPAPRSGTPAAATRMAERSGADSNATAGCATGISARSGEQQHAVTLRHMTDVASLGFLFSFSSLFPIVLLHALKLARLNDKQALRQAKHSHSQLYSVVCFNFASILVLLFPSIPMVGGVVVVFIIALSINKRFFFLIPTSRL